MSEPTRGEADYIKLNPWKQKEAAIQAQKKAEEEARARAEAERLAKEKEKRKWKPPKKTGEPEVSPMNWKFGGFSSYVPPPKKKPQPKKEPVQEPVNDAVLEEKTLEQETEKSSSADIEKPPPPSHKEPTYVSNNPWKKKDRAVGQAKKQEANFGSGNVSIGNNSTLARSKVHSKGTEDALAVISKSRTLRQAAATNTMRESTKTIKSEETVKTKSNFNSLHGMLNKAFGLNTEEEEKEPEKPRPKPKKNANFASMHAMLQSQFGGKVPPKSKIEPKEEVKKIKKGVAAKLMAKLIGGKKLKLLPPGDPGYDKYEKMRQRGLPEGAIRNCLERDGFDPEGFFNPKPVEASTPTVQPSQPQQQQQQQTVPQQNMQMQQPQGMMMNQQGYQNSPMQMGYNQQMLPPNGMMPDQNFAYSMPPPPQQQQGMPYHNMPQHQQAQYQQMPPQPQYRPVSSHSQYQQMHPQQMQQQYPQQHHNMQYSQPPPPPAPATVGSYPGHHLLMSSSRSIQSTHGRESARRRHQGNTIPRGRPDNSYDDLSVYKSTSSSLQRSRRRNQNYNSSSRRRSPNGEMSASFKNTNPRYGSSTRKRAKKPREPRSPPPGSVASGYDDTRSETGTYLPTEPNVPPPSHDFDDSLTVTSYRSRDGRELSASMRRHPRQAGSVRDMRGTFMNSLDDAFAASPIVPDKYGRSKMLSKDVTHEGNESDTRQLNKTKKRKGKPKKKGKGIIATLTRKKKKKPAVESYRDQHSRGLIESFSEIDLSAIKEQRKKQRTVPRMKSSKTLGRGRSVLNEERVTSDAANEWAMEYSEEFNRPFYVNQRTGERTWTTPPELM